LPKNLTEAPCPKDRRQNTEWCEQRAASRKQTADGGRLRVVVPKRRGGVTFSQTDFGRRGNPQTLPHPPDRIVALVASHREILLRHLGLNVPRQFKK